MPKMATRVQADASRHLQIVLGRLLGKGMFGQTYLGCWRGGDLAVKCVRVSKESEAASFLREVAALAALRHPNVMQFYGGSLCTDLLLRRKAHAAAMDAVVDAAVLAPDALSIAT